MMNSKQGTELWLQVLKLHDELHNFEKEHREVLSQYSELKHKYKKTYTQYIEEVLVYESDDEEEE